MRVNVTYSIELEEVNELVENILKQIEKDFESLSDDFPKIMYSVVEDQNEKKAVAFTPPLVKQHKGIQKIFVLHII